MYKNIFSLIIATLLMPTFSFSMTTESTNNPQTEKAKVEKELKKNEAELQTLKKNKTLAPVLEKIEALINKVVTSPEFKSTIETITTQQAQEINQGKTLEDVKYTHSLSTEFPKMGPVHKLLTRLYTLMANIQHYQLLKEKLSSIQEPSPIQMPTLPSATDNQATPTAQ